MLLPKPLLKSLLCVRGFDTGRRFLLISTVAYLLCIGFSGLFARSIVLLVLVVATGLVLVGLSGLRRIKDAELPVWLSLFPALSFAICAYGLGFFSHGGRWLILLLAVAVSAIFSLIGNRKKRKQKNYDWGYAGPVSLKTGLDSRQNSFSRIEPVFAGLSDAPPQASFSSSASKLATGSMEDPGQGSSSDWAMGSPQVIGGVVLLLLVIAVVGFELTRSSSPNQEKPEEPVEKAVETSKQRIDKLPMPDNFWLMLDQNQALTIAWQGEVVADGEVWSALTGRGDASCFEISFNGRENFRVMRVEAKNQGDYYADFSPVDTRKLVESIALKDKFKLCGIEFSLKGTQGELMSHRGYSGYLTESTP